MTKKEEEKEEEEAVVLGALMSSVQLLRLNKGQDLLQTLSFVNLFMLPGYLQGRCHHHHFIAEEMKA